MNCPVCQAPDSRKLDEQPRDYEYEVDPGEEFHIRECLRCSSRFLWPRPSLTNLETFYPPDYHAYHADHGLIAGVLTGLRSRMRRDFYLRSTTSRPIRLFDVGSGDCRQFESLKSSDAFTFSGVELNTAMVENARARGYDIRCGDLENLDLTGLENSFDIVTMYQLVEHTLSPSRLFAQAFRLLKPGGMVIGQLPCKDSWEAALFKRHWAGYHFPRHLQQITKKGMESLLVDQGFERVSVSAALHLQAALSLQNVFVDRFPPQKRLHFGKTSFYPLLLLLVAPYCLVEYAFGKGGMMNFLAFKTGEKA